MNRLQIQIRRQPAALRRVVVVYQNGDRQRLRIRESFNAGESTRWVTLNGGPRGRCIKSIRVVGESLANGPRRSVIRIVAMKRNGGGHGGGFNN